MNVDAYKIIHRTSVIKLKSQEKQQHIMNQLAKFGGCGILDNVMVMV